MSSRERMLSVVFAAVAGSSRLFEKLAGAEALHAVDRCMKRMRRGIDGFHGRIVKTGRDDLTAVFANANDACQAAIAMQRRVADLPPVSGVQLAIQVGFHHGAVIEELGEFLGECVNTAESLARLAGAGQVLTSGTTQVLLSPHQQLSIRPLENRSIAGQPAELQVFEVLWLEHASEPAKAIVEPHAPVQDRELRLCVRYGHIVKVLDKHRTSLLMGRDTSCEITVRDRRASRNHALIERRGEHFVLTDVSTNGTFVTVNGEQELFLKHEELALHGSGIIAFAAPAGSSGADIAEFEHL
ncbi:MAG: adenylate/guanylate cyclase domain-containing protein [Candidatus Accumulibacter phosphatis]|jgi:adenylate cyclase